VFRRGNSTLELQRDGDGWKILRPLSAPADATAVDDLLAKIHALRLESFQLENKPASSGDSRFDSSVEAQFFTNSGETPYTIQIVPSTAEAPATVHLESRKMSGTTNPEAATLFSPDLETLRDTALLRINLDLVDVIRVDRNGAQRDITRTRDGWSEESENVQNIAKNLARTKVSARLPATPSELQKSGLDKPQAIITFLSVLSENTPEATAGEHIVAGFKIGTALPDGRLPVLVDGTPEIRLVSANLLNSLP
jgi:hypothetical protein